jgi:hypothetical protein
MGDRRCGNRVSVQRPEGSRSLVKPQRRREDNIKMDLPELGWENVMWIDLAQGRHRW